MSEGSFKTKLLAAWAPLILVPPTGTQIRILLFLLLYTLATLDFHLSLSLSLFLSFLLHATLLPPHEFTSISILIPSSVTLFRSHSFVVKATYNRFLGNFFFGTTRPLFFRDTRIGSRKMQKPSSFLLFVILEITSRSVGDNIAEIRTPVKQRKIRGKSKYKRHCTETINGFCLSHPPCHDFFDGFLRFLTARRHHFRQLPSRT